LAKDLCFSGEKREDRGVLIGKKNKKTKALYLQKTLPDQLLYFMQQNFYFA